MDRACEINYEPTNERAFPILLEGESPLSTQSVVVMRGLKRQQVAALTNFVGCILLTLIMVLFSLLLLSALNDLTGSSTGPLVRITYSFPLRERGVGYKRTVVIVVA